MSTKVIPITVKSVTKLQFVEVKRQSYKFKLFGQYWWHRPNDAVTILGGYHVGK